MPRRIFRRGSTVDERWNSYFWENNPNEHIDPTHGKTDKDVLKNKHGVRNGDDLEILERRLTAARQREMTDNRLEDFSFTPDGYRLIHYHLFQDVYDWAGEDRESVLHKGFSAFTAPEYIDDYLVDIFQEIRDSDNLKGLSQEEFSERAAEYMNRLNSTHPFREGNGRTSRCFLKELSIEAGHEIDLDRINPAEWKQASIIGHNFHNSEPFAEIINDAVIRPDRARSQGETPAVDPDDPEARRRAEYRARGEAAETKHDKAMADKAKAPPQEPGQKPGQDIDD